MFRYLPWNTDQLLAEQSEIEAAATDLGISFFVMMVAFMLLSGGIVFGIPNNPNVNRKDPRKRRIVFWLLMAIIPSIFFTIYIVGVRAQIAEERQSEVSGFYQDTFIYAFLAIACSVAIGFIASKVPLRRTKYGDIFGKPFNR